MEGGHPQGFGLSNTKNRQRHSDIRLGRDRRFPGGGGGITGTPVKEGGGKMTIFQVPSPSSAPYAVCPVWDKRLYNPAIGTPLLPHQAEGRLPNSLTRGLSPTGLQPSLLRPLSFSPLPELSPMSHSNTPDTTDFGLTP